MPISLENRVMAKKSSGKQNKPGQASAAQRRENIRQQRQENLQRTQPQQRNRRKAQSGSNRTLWIALGTAVVAIAVIIGVFVYISSQSSTGNTYPTTPADPAVVQEVTSVSQSTLAAVGTGSGKVANPPKPLSGSPAPLTGPNGKPEVFYYGGEYCPFCAAERWGMIVALSRFGTFSNLKQTSSSSSDVYPNTPTFSFYGSSYTSQYIDFVPVEGQSYQGVTLQQLTSAQQQLVNTYNPGGSIPFIDIANKYTLTGASYDPQVLSGQTPQAIAAALSNPQSPIAQSILGTANYFTAAICEATNQQPASVCAAAPVPQLEQSLNSTSGYNGVQQNRALSLEADMRRLFRG
jgi:thiol-disulfide isomerase/thioredoxin